MKKLLFVTENEKQRILEMHRITDKSTVISEQVKELEHLVSNSFVKGLEKNDVKAFDELSTIIGRKGSETLDVAFVRVLDSAIKGGNRADGVNALKFCKKLSLINDEFAEKFYQSQIKVIDKIRLHPEYSKQWELMVKANFGERVLEKYKKGLSSSSTNASSKIDELGIASQINSYLNPNRFDGLTKQSKDIKWLEWNEQGRVREDHNEPAIGRSLLMSPFNDFFTWMTTDVTEIVEEREDYIKFKTRNSNYELWKLKND